MVDEAHATGVIGENGRERQNILILKEKWILLLVHFQKLLEV